MSADAIARMRADFPGTERSVYLDVAARGLVSRGVRAATDDYLDRRMFEGADKAWMFERAEGARAAFAGLIGASADEVALTRNVSDGINAFANAIDWRAGDNVVLCESLEHPANVFPWRNLARRRGVEIRSVAPADGRVPPEGLAVAVDGRTRVVAVSRVSFAPGFAFPVGALSAVCREKGALLLVDGAQSEGILATDVDALGIDALATSTQKGLLALYGAGFLYVRRAVAERLSPVYLSRAGVAADGAHEASSGDPAAFAYAGGARRFDVGNHNFLAAVAVERSIAELRTVGSAAVEAHALRLAGRLADGLDALGLPVYGGPGPRTSHIVAVGSALSDEHDRVSDAALVALHDFLVTNGVRLTIRRGMLRFSFHVYNDESDVDAVLSLAGDFLRKAVPARARA